MAETPFRGKFEAPFPPLALSTNASSLKSQGLVQRLLELLEILPAEDRQGASGPTRLEGFTDSV